MGMKTLGEMNNEDPLTRHKKSVMTDLGGIVLFILFSMIVLIVPWAVFVFVTVRAFRFGWTGE